MCLLLFKRTRDTTCKGIILYSRNFNVHGMFTHILFSYKVVNGIDTSYYNISEVLYLLQKIKQKMIAHNGDNYANKIYIFRR